MQNVYPQIGGILIHLPYRNPRTWEGNYKRPVPPPVVPQIDIVPQSRTALITVGVGERGSEMSSVSGPIFKDYAERIGADYHHITGSCNPEYPMNEKYRIYPYFDFYDRLMYLDADIILTPDCPSLFDVVPEFCIGMYDDMPDTDRVYDHHWQDVECELLCDSQGWPRTYLKAIMNTGVIVASKMHKGMFEPPPKPYPNSFCMEQTYINFKILENQYKVCKLDKKYNCQWWADRQYENTEGIHVWHFAGQRVHALRMRGMRFMAEGKFEEAFRVGRMWHYNQRYLLM